MSFGSKPQTTVNDPYKNMPEWVRVYYQNQIARTEQSDNRADALRQMFSGFNPEESAAVEGYETPGMRVQPMGNSASTQAALSRVVGGSTGGGDGGGGMWSDGMTGSEIRQHQADRTFGASTPSQQSAYDRQMESYTNSGGGMSMGFGNTVSEALSGLRR